jgi:hypothetical protein
MKPKVKQGRSMFKRKIIDKLTSELDAGRISILPAEFPCRVSLRLVTARRCEQTVDLTVEKMSPRVGQRR